MYDANVPYDEAPEIGNYRKILWGRVIIGVDKRRLLVSYAMIVTTWIICMIFLDITRIQLSLCVFAMINNLSMLTLTATVEPGILPRQSFNPAHAPTEDIESDSDTAEHSRFCQTCNIRKPSRTKHCKYCNCCIEEMDHHCPWTGQCIGRRNYKYFLYMMTSLVFSSLYGLNLAISSTISVMTILIILWTGFMATVLSILFLFHVLVLMCRDQTTNEFLKGEITVRHRPYLQLCKYIFIDFKGPSKLTKIWPSSEMVQLLDDVLIDDEW